MEIFPKSAFFAKSLITKLLRFYANAVCKGVPASGVTLHRWCVSSLALLAATFIYHGDRIGSFESGFVGEFADYCQFYLSGIEIALYF